VASETIFAALDAKGITWKIYIDADNTTTDCPDTTPAPQAACILKNYGYLENFTYANAIESSPNILNYVGTMEDFFSDMANGTLPQVAMIEPPSEQGLDEHGTDNDASGGEKIQQGEKFAASIINGLMATATSGYNYWADTALFFTYDESGGLYDHVSPQPEPSPDGITPVDLGTSGSVCSGFDYSTEASRQTTCDFTWTGYRIPLIVVSSFAKKNYVSHTVADSTAILKFIETRFGLAPLNARDAAQPDMTEFFDFNNPQWTTPPNGVPSQDLSMPCDLSVPLQQYQPN
jgi:phospholipase C